MGKETQGTNTQSYGQSNTTLTTTRCLQKEPKYELGISHPHAKSCSTSLHTRWGWKNENKRALMATKKLDSAKPNPWWRMRKLGLRCKLSKHPFYGGGYSTCPPKYSVSRGSNGIVYTALSGNQIIAHNLNSDYNDNINCKVKSYHYNDKP